MRIIHTLPLLLVLLIPFIGQGQEGKLTSSEVKEILQEARKDFQLADFNNSFEHYTDLLRNDPNNAQLNYEAGVCLFEGSFDKAKAIPFFEKSYENMDKEEPIEELYYYMGRSYHYNQQYLFAIASYNTFLNYTKDNRKGKELKNEVLEYIDQCEKGRIQLKQGKDKALKRVDRRYEDIRKFYVDGKNYIKLTNLGPQINSKYSDYGPILLENNRYLLFTSRKEGSTGGEQYFDGQYFEDVYLAQKIEDNKYSQVRNLTEVTKFDNTISNTNEHDATVSVSPDGNTIFFYQDNIIEEIKYDGEKWVRQSSFKELFENPGNFVTSACLSPNNQTLFVVSDRDDAIGGRDIFISTKMEDGSWSDMKNLGGVINTKKDESSPYLPNDTTLYFSSKGHNSIGGYDVFVSYKRAGIWTTPQNLEIPINTPFDEINYVVSPKGDLAYYASNRDEGYGQFDIYFITKGYDETIDPALLALFEEAEEEEKEGPSEILPDSLLAVSEKETTSNDSVSDLTQDSTAIAQTEQDQEKEQEKAITEKEKESIQKDKTSVKEKETTKPKEQDVVLVKGVTFAFNSTQLNQSTKQKLEKVAASLKKDPNTFAQIIGHADSIGTEEANNRVSRLRALRAYNYLLEKGVQPNQLAYTYRGDSDPIASNKTEEGRAQNRRVEINTTQYELLANIQFGFDEKDVSPSAYETLSRVLTYAKNNPNKTIHLSGHTDPYGSKRYNLLLAEWRVESVANYLRENGVTNSFNKKFFGEDKPRFPNNLFENRQLNRRVQITVF